MDLDFYHTVESDGMVDPNYIDMQTAGFSKEKHRVVIEWIIQICEEEKFRPETLHLSVSIFNRFMNKYLVNIKRVQLVAIGSIIIASKYEEINWISIHSFKDLYPTDMIFSMERHILFALNFELSKPTAYSFFANWCINSEPRLVKLCSHILQLSLLEYSMLKYKPSHIAAAAIYLTRKCAPKKPWTRNLERVTTYSEQDLIPIVDFLSNKIENLENKN